MKIVCMFCEKVLGVSAHQYDNINAMCDKCLELLEKQEKRFVKTIVDQKKLIKENITFES